MAEKLGFFTQWLGGTWAERNTINANADALTTVEARVKNLQATAARQAREIIQLRATLMGLADVLQSKVQFDDAELEHRVKAALDRLMPTSKAQTKPGEIDAAQKLLKMAEDHHYAKRFAEARSLYNEIVEKYANTEQAATARQQLDNLRGA